MLSKKSIAHIYCVLPSELGLEKHFFRVKPMKSPLNPFGCKREEDFYASPNQRGLLVMSSILYIVLGSILDLILLLSHYC